MNKEKEFLKIAKYIACEFSESDNENNIEFLDNWLKESKENQEIYDAIMKDGWYDSNLKTAQNFKAQEGWDTISTKIESNSKVKTLVPNFFKYAAAAILIGILATTFFYRDNLFVSPQENTPVIVNDNTDIIVPGTNKAVLTLEDGSMVALGKSNLYSNNNVNSDGEQIVYKNAKTNKTEIKYNYLTIPRGGQFYLKLSDGTQVWLNSETQLKYPINFIKGETREIELVYGEAYFDVSPSTEHNGAHFKVINKAQEVEVLGTEFNIKAYEDELNVYTTLVEGEVEINTPQAKQLLKPNEQSNINLATNHLTVEVVDVNTEISWKNGVFYFEQKPLKYIMKVISRWYDVDVVFENKDLEDIKFNGKVKKHQNIEQILSIIKSNTIDDYEIKGKIILLK